ncbi:hypothetical protein [Hymenobacter metallicola]|uniref:Uncharacterized protein n=1 Tax=Hymenobacter metallicola TaxID=2563114 RepID=A0A4Z0QIZ2_9BACT|nr:hypothetical protein [Hymenobacter metallicola]TGE29675.1 hypothetical protein E5K02_09530 [Hymenobacter metallicola]
MHKFIIAGLLLLVLKTYPAAAQTYIVDVSKHAIALEPTGSYRVVQVIDARADRTRLGAVYQGLDNVLTSATFAEPLEETLLRHILPTQPAAPARPVSMRVHVLSLGEDIRPSVETGTVELVVDFLEKRDQGYAVLATHGETLESTGLDVTGKLAPLLSQALRNSLLKLAALPANAAPLGPVLSEPEVLNGTGGIAAVRYPIQQEPLRRGIYRTFAEFQANQPSINQEPFVLTYRKRTGKQWDGAARIDANYLYMSPEKPERPVRDVWGLCDGEKLYILHRNDFFELQPQGCGYTFTGITPANSSDVAAATLLGGLAGGVLAGAISGGQPRPYEVHLASGRVVASAPALATDAQGFVQADTAAIYLYRRPDAVPSQTLKVVIDNQEVATLLPSSYVALGWRDRRHKITLCVQGAQQACYSFIPDFAVATYLECAIPSAVNEVPTFRRVLTKEGIFYVKRFRPRK